MKLNIYLLVLLSIIFTGCVSTKNIKIKDDVAKQMRGKTILTTVSEKPYFTAMTAEKAAFSWLGMAAMISDGNRIIEENDVKDPAQYIGEKLVIDLSKKNSLIISSIGNIELTDNINDLVKKYNDKDYILDIRTINWSFVYFPTDWNNYRIIYSAKLRLIDVRNKSIIAEGFCAKKPEDQSENSPTYDQIVADHATVLKNELRTASDECIKNFKENIF